MGSSIDYFRRGHWLSHVQERVSLRVRRKIFEGCPWGASQTKVLRVLDVGATPDQERKDSNCMIGWLLDRGHEVTAASIEEIRPLKVRYPRLQILEKLRPMPTSWPIEKRSFDWCLASAVVEHVGARNSQVRFLAECGRTSHRMLLTTPNRYHWLEFHTKLPFIHWLPKNLHRRILRALGLRFWGDEANLNLVTKSELEAMATEALGDEFVFSVKSVWALGMPSNLVLIAERRDAHEIS